MNRKIVIIISIIVLFLAVLAGFWWWQKSQTGALDDFAKCLGSQGAKFYGAFWCPHCQTQKKLFGSSQKYLPYIECSTPDGNSQLPVCREAKVQAYPTWEFADGSREQGELTLQKLSEKSSCPLPQ